MKNAFVLLAALFLVSFHSYGEKKEFMIRQGQSEVMEFNSGWKFIRYGLQAEGSYIKEPDELFGVSLDETGWQPVRLPHDFAIEGPFRMDLSGNTGRLPFKGIGWYRKTFNLSPNDLGKQIYIDFDGVMAYAQVWLNGHYVGTWPYGYNSFRLDLTPYINTNGKNVLAVRTDTEKWDSRWYPGAGIYRNVWLVKTGKVHVGHWGTFVTTPQIKSKQAQIDLKVKVENHTASAQQVEVLTTIYETDKEDRLNKLVLRMPLCKAAIEAKATTELSTSADIANFKRWDILTPNRYIAKTEVKVDGKISDCYYTPFGIREIKVSREGFFLNGNRVDLKGVCLHHDLGALGAAFNKSALQRQFRIMQEMGCNSIRTSHNPPAPELLELADKMGVIIMDEAFDAWAKGKKRWDYNKLYLEWHEKDLRAMILRDRNHPSIAFWSIGNEVHEQRDVEMTKHLVDIVKSTDNTRFVTCGYNDPNGGRASGASMALDVMGVNYFFDQQGKWDIDERYKNKATVGTETSSCVSTRGVYFFDGVKRKDFQITSYDLDAPDWGCTPDKQFATNARYPHLLGEYVWTGFDYIGEPTPYNSDETNLLNFRTDPSKKSELERELDKLKANQPPSRSSYFGIVDLAGFPKDRYYSYQAHWRPELPMAHIFPHWNWSDRIGKDMPVHVYTSGTEAELFVNGKSYGKKSKEAGKDFRLVWDHVKYEPGTVKVVAYKNGKIWAKDEIHTSGAAYKVNLTADKKTISSDGKEYAFITLQIVDQKGRFVPTDNSELKIKVSGCGELVATDNGDPTSFVPFQSPVRSAFNGLALAIVRAKAGQKGQLVVRVEAKGLQSSPLTIHVK